MQGRKLTMDICDYSKNYVCNLYDSQSNAMGQATDVFIQQQRNAWKELSFNIPSVTISGNKPERNYRLDYIKADYYIRVSGDVLDGQDYYVISQPRIQHSAFSTNVTVTCSHISSLLKLKNLGLQFSDDLGNNVGTAEQLLATVLAGSGWQVGDVYPFAETFDPSIIKHRSLTAAAKTGAFKLVQEICNLFDAKPIYHGKTNKVDLLPINPFSDEADVFSKEEQGALGNVIQLQYGKNLSGLQRTLNTDNIVTKLYAYGSFGDKVKGYCGIDECLHTQYTIVPTTTLAAGTKYRFTVKDDSGLDITRTFTPKEDIPAGRTIIYSFLDPESMSYVWVRPSSSTAKDGVAIQVSEDTIGSQQISIDSNNYIVQFPKQVRGSTIYTVGDSTNPIVNCFMYSFKSGDKQYCFVSPSRIKQDQIGKVNLNDNTITIGDSTIAIYDKESITSFSISGKNVSVIGFDGNRVQIQIQGQQITTEINIEDIELQANRTRKKNYFSFLLDFSYYKKIGLLTDEDLNLIGEYQNESQQYYKTVEQQSLTLANKQTQLAQTIGSVNFAKLSISNVYDDGLVGPYVVLRVDADNPEYDNGVIYRSDYNATKKNRFKYITTQSLDDNGDPVNSGASILYIIPSNWDTLSPKRWIKAYVKQVDDQSDPTQITLWLNASQYAGVISQEDSFFVFQSNNINGRLGTYESYDEALLRTIEKSTTIASIPHPVYFGSIPPSPSYIGLDINTHDPSVAQLIKNNQAYVDTLDGYAWYWQYNPSRKGTLYFCRKSRTDSGNSLMNDSDWKIVYVQDTDSTSGLPDQGYMFNWKSSKLFKYNSGQWKYLDDYTSKQISSYFGTVYTSCLQRDKYYKGIKRYYERVNAITNAGNYYFDNGYGDFYAFNVPQDDIMSIQYDTDTGWISMATINETQLDAIKPKIYRFDNVRYHPSNILDGVIFEQGTINAAGAFADNTGSQYDKRTASTIQVVPGTTYILQQIWDKDSGIKFIYEYDYNGKFITSSDIHAAQSYTVSSSTYYVRFVSTFVNEDFVVPNAVIQAQQYSTTIIIDDANYFKLEQTDVSTNPTKGILSYMDAFIKLAEECYQELFVNVSDAQNAVRRYENQITSKLGMTYRQGYWQSDNYVDGDQNRLYADAIDNLKKISQPQVTYSINYIDLFAANKDMMYAVDESLSGVDYPDVTTSSPIHLIDEQLDIDCWAYVDRLKKCYDVPQKTTLQINTNLTTMSQHSFSDVMSNIADVASTAKGNASKYNSTSQTAPTMNEVIDVVNSMIASDRRLQSTYTQIQDINDTLITNQSTIKQTADMIQTQVIRARDSENYLMSSIQQTAGNVSFSVFQQLVNNNILSKDENGNYIPGSAISSGQSVNIAQQLVALGVLKKEQEDGKPSYSISDNINNDNVDNSNILQILQKAKLITRNEDNTVSINQNVITHDTQFTVGTSGISGKVTDVFTSLYTTANDASVAASQAEATANDAADIANDAQQDASNALGVVNSLSDDYYKQIDIEWITGKYLNKTSGYMKDGDYGNSSNFRVRTIPCNQRDTFLIKNISIRQEASHLAAIWGFYDENKRFIQGVQSSSSADGSEILITAPQSARWLVVNDCKNNNGEFIGQVFKQNPIANIPINANNDRLGPTIQGIGVQVRTNSSQLSQTQAQILAIVNKRDDITYIDENGNTQTGPSQYSTSWLKEAANKIEMSVSSGVHTSKYQSFDLHHQQNIGKDIYLYNQVSKQYELAYTFNEENQKYYDKYDREVSNIDAISNKFVQVYSLDADKDGFEFNSSGLTITPNNVNISSTGSFTVDASNINIDRSGTLSANNAYLSGDIYNVVSGTSYPVLSSYDIYVGYTQPVIKHEGMIWIRPKAATTTQSIPQQNQTAMNSQRIQLVYTGTDPSNQSKALYKNPLSINVSGTGCARSGGDYTYILYVTLRRQTSENAGGYFHVRLAGGGNYVDKDVLMPPGGVGQESMVITIQSPNWIASGNSITVSLTAGGFSGGSCNRKPAQVILKCIAQAVQTGG